MTVASPAPAVHGCAVVDGASGFDDIVHEFLDGDGADRYEPVVVRADDAVAFYHQLERKGAAAMADHFAARGREARQRGLLGIRVVADVTPLVLDDRARRSYLDYELVVDRRMRAEGTLFGLCVVDSSVADLPTQRSVCRVHEWARPAADFSVFTSPGAYRLVGEVDADAVAGLAELVDLAVTDEPLVFDLTGCSFLHHRALVALEAAVAARAVDVVLEHPPPVTRRLVELLELRHVEVRA